MNEIQICISRYAQLSRGVWSPMCTPDLTNTKCKLTQIRDQKFAQEQEKHVIYKSSSQQILTYKIKALNDSGEEKNTGQSLEMLRTRSQNNANDKKIQ